MIEHDSKSKYQPLNSNSLSILERARKSPQSLLINEQHPSSFEEAMTASSFSDKLFEFSEQQHSYIGFLGDLKRHEPLKGLAELPDGSVLFSILQEETQIVVVFESDPKHRIQLDSRTEAIVGRSLNPGFEHIKAIIFVVPAHKPAKF